MAPEYDSKPVEDWSRRATKRLHRSCPERHVILLLSHFIHVCCSVYPPQAFGSVGPPTTEQRLRCIAFLPLFALFLVADRHAFCLRLYSPPCQALNMNGIRGVLAGVTNERFIPRLRLATLGWHFCTLRNTSSRRIEQAGREGRGGEMTARTGRPILWFFSRFPFFLLPPGETEGLDLLVWVNMQREGGQRSSKTGVGKAGTAKRICILRK